MNDNTRLDCSDIPCNKHNGYNQTDCHLCEIESLTQQVAELKAEITIHTKAGIALAGKLKSQADTIKSQKERIEKSISFFDYTFDYSQEYIKANLTKILTQDTEEACIHHECKNPAQKGLMICYECSLDELN